MARGRKKKDAPVEKTVKMTASEFQGAIREAGRLKDQTSSYQGFHGQHVKAFCEKTSYSRKAFGFIRMLDGLGDDLKRQSLIREVLMGIELMGWDRQGDMFDDVSEEIANRVATEPESDDPRSRFMHDAMPLDEAERAFTPKGDGFGAATQEVKQDQAAGRRKKHDPLADLAAGPDHPPVH